MGDGADELEEREVPEGDGRRRREGGVVRAEAEFAQRRAVLRQKGAELVRRVVAHALELPQPGEMGQDGLRVVFGLDDERRAMSNDL